MKCELCDKSATWMCSCGPDSKNVLKYYPRCNKHYYISGFNMTVEEYLTQKVFES